METRKFKNLTYVKDEHSGIVTVAINRPEIKNALTITVILELAWAVDAVKNDDSAKAMILTGTKPPDSSDPTKEAFSSGGYFDLTEYEALDEATKKEIDLKKYPTQYLRKNNPYRKDIYSCSLNLPE